MQQTPAGDVVPQTTMLRLAAALARNAGRIIAGALIGGALLAAWSLAVAPRYRASAKFALDDQPPIGSGSGLAALASQFGAGGLPGTRSIQFYTEVLTGRDLLEAAVLDSFPVPGNRNRRAPLLEILHVDGKTRARQMDNAVGFMQRAAVKTATNDRTGTITLTVIMPDAQLAADVATHLYQLLERFNYERRRSAASERRRFAERELARAQADLASAEGEMRGFLEANRAGLEAPRLAYQRERIDRRVRLASDVYRTLVNELQEAKIAEVRDTPVFTLLQTPEAPVDRDFPNRKRMTLLGALFGAAIVAAWVAIRAAGWSARALDPAGFEQLAAALPFRRRSRRVAP